MLCKKPYRKGVLEFGCGQCLPCRLNKRREWTARLVLESLSHDQQIWTTLTYDQHHLPEGNSLKKEHYQYFIRKLRKAIKPVKLRYYIVGEYGDTTLRPHYHAALFGTSNTDIISSCWKHGHVHFGSIQRESLQYNTSHITKGLTNAKNPYVQKQLAGREPEFARMSLKPGIGHDAAVNIAKWLTTDKGSKYLANNMDVVQVFRMDGYTWPLGRYLRGVVRSYCGMDKKTPKDKIYKLAMERLTILEENGPEAFEIDREFHQKKAAQRIKLSNSKRGL